MKLLLKRLFRDIYKGLGQFISLMLVIAVGSFFFAGMNEASQGLKTVVDDYYSAQSFASVTGGFLVADEQALDMVKAEKGVLKAEGRYVYSGFLSYGGSGRVDATVSTMTADINLPQIKTGNMPANDFECLIDQTYAEANSLQVGDRVKLFVKTAESVQMKTTDGSFNTDKIDYESIKIAYTDYRASHAKYVDMTVSGTFTSPEYLYKLNTADPSAKAEEFACVIVPPPAVSMIQDEVQFFLNSSPLPFYVLKSNTVETKLFNQILVLGDVGKEVFDKVKNMALDIDSGMVGVYIDELSFTQKGSVSDKSFVSAYDQIKNLVLVLPMLFFIVAAVITFISMSKTVESRRTQIGVMQAVGYSKASIYFEYILYAMIASLLGSLIGGILGVFAVPYIYYLAFSAMYVMPPFYFTITPVWILVGAAVSLGVGALSAFVSCRRILKEIPAQAMRPKAPRKSRPILLERFPGLWKRMGFGAKMVWRNLLQNKMRVLLSSIGVIASMMLLITGVNLKSRIDYTVKDYENRINYDYSVILTDEAGTGDNLLEKISGAEEALLIPQTSVTVGFNDVKSDTLQLQGLPGGNDFIKLYSKFGQKDLIDFQNDSFVLPQYVAEDLGAKKGDTVTVSAPGSVPKNVVVTDIAYQYLLPGIFAGYGVLEDMGIPLSSTTCFVRAEGAIGGDALKTVSDKAALVDRALKMSVILDMAVIIIVLGAAVLAVTVIYNITAINVMERSREIATLMVLGYKRHETSRIIIVENLVITAIGSLIGLPLGYGIFFWLSQIVSSLNVSIPLNLPLGVIGICIAAVFAFSMIATLMLLRKLMKIDMVEALKGAE